MWFLLRSGAEAAMAKIDPTPAAAQHPRAKFVKFHNVAVQQGQLLAYTGRMSGDCILCHGLNSAQRAFMRASIEEVPLHTIGDICEVCLAATTANLRAKRDRRTAAAVSRAWHKAKGKGLSSS
jgi:hypothetical protein